MLVNRSVDGRMQGADAAVNAALDLLVGEPGEEPFDLVERGRIGGNEMDIKIARYGNLDFVEKAANRAMMSRSYVTKSGSVESLNVSI